MQINLIDIVEHVLNIVVLYLILRALVYKPVLSYMKNREARLEKQREAAQSELDSAQKMKEQYETALENAKSEAENTVQEGVQRADRTAKEIIEKAEKDAGAIMADMREQSAREEREVVKNMKGEVTGLAVDLASKIMAREVTIDDNRNVIEQFFSKVG